MKNTFKFYAIAILLGVLAVSCKKKSGEPDITSLPYANEAVETSKTNLSNTGQQMVTELSTLSDVNGISASQSMSYFLDLSNPFAGTTLSAVAFASVRTSAESGANKDVKGIYRFLSASVQNSTDSTLTEIFTFYKGIYTWNPGLQKWDKTASTDKIEFLFPSTKTGTSNNAKLDLTYQGKTITSSSSVSYNGELPLTFDAVLSVGTDKVMEYYFNAQYNSSNEPSYVNTFLALYPFKFETTVNNNSSNASVRYLFTDNDKTIFDFFASVDGDLTTSSTSTAESSINNANAYFQVLDIKLAGRIDLKNLAQKESDIYSDETTTDEQKNTAEVAAMNQYIALVLMYADTKQKIAQAEFYATQEVDYYGYTYYSQDMRFIFTDGSKGSLESYFGNGFKDVVNDFNTLLIKLNNNFGLGASTVNYSGS